MRFLFKNSRSFWIDFFDSGFLGKLVFENFWTIGGNRLVLDPVGMFPLFLCSLQRAQCVWKVRFVNLYMKWTKVVYFIWTDSLRVFASELSRIIHNYSNLSNKKLKLGNFWQPIRVKLLYKLTLNYLGVTFVALLKFDSSINGQLTVNSGLILTLYSIVKTFYVNSHHSG